MKNLLDKIKKIRKRHQRKKKFKRIRKALRKIFSKDNIIKVIVIFSGLALIASFTLPYIL